MADDAHFVSFAEPSGGSPNERVGAVPADVILRALIGHGVRFVVDRWTGSPGSRFTLADRRPRHLLRPDGENLTRLAAALDELSAIRRGMPDGVDRATRRESTARGRRLYADDAVQATSTFSRGRTRGSTTTGSSHAIRADRVASNTSDREPCRSHRMKRAAGRPKDRSNSRSLARSGKNSTGAVEPDRHRSGPLRRATLA